MQRDDPVRRALDGALEAAERLCEALSSLRPDAIVEAAHAQACALEALEALDPGAWAEQPSARARAMRLRGLVEQQQRLRRRGEAILRRLRALDPAGVHGYGPRARSGRGGPSWRTRVRTA